MKKLLTVTVALNVLGALTFLALPTWNVRLGWTIADAGLVFAWVALLTKQLDGPGSRIAREQ